MGTSAKAELPRVIAGVLLGVAALWLANQLMDPVPISAGAAFAAGALILVLRCLRPLRPGYVVLGACSGALPALWVHRAWHLDGASPAHDGPLLAHILGEGLLGIAVALVCLGLAALATQRLRPVSA